MLQKYADENLSKESRANYRRSQEPNILRKLTHQNTPLFFQMEKQIEKKNEEIENLKVSVDVENIYAEECDSMRNKMVTLDIDRALLKSENGKLTRQIKEKSHLIHQKKQQIGMLSNQMS